MPRNKPMPYHLRNKPTKPMQTTTLAYVTNTSVHTIPFYHLLNHHLLQKLDFQKGWFETSFSRRTFSLTASTLAAKGQCSCQHNIHSSSGTDAQSFTLPMGQGKLKTWIVTRADTMSNPDGVEVTPETSHHFAHFVGSGRRNFNLELTTPHPNPRSNSPSNITSNHCAPICIQSQRQPNIIKPMCVQHVKQHSKYIATTARCIH